MFESYSVEGDESRPPDDWQPRHNMKKTFDNGTLKLDDEEAISTFSNKFIVENELVKDHLLHLTTLERTKNFRAKDKLEKRQQRRQKLFEEYNWDTLCRIGEIQQLTVPELEKYLTHFNLSLKGKKNDKMRRIICHASNIQGEEINAYISTRQDRDMRIREKEISYFEEESDSEDDLVIAHYSSAESLESKTNEEELVPVVQLSRRTRSGRSIGISFSRYRDCFL